MSARLVAVTEITPLPHRAEDLAVRWARSSNDLPAERRGIFLSLDGTSIMELAALDRIEDLATCRPGWPHLEAAFAPHLAADWRRQVLGYVESVKPCPTPLPETPYLQMRHVEVKPPVYPDYREWRDRTIYGVVRRAPEVEVFLSYHSLVSTEPGVMFLSGFSTDPDSYSRVFATDEYRRIVQEAGDTYITGGAAGLYTRLYRRIAP